MTAMIVIAETVTAIEIAKDPIETARAVATQCLNKETAAEIQEETANPTRNQAEKQEAVVETANPTINDIDLNQDQEVATAESNTINTSPMAKTKKQHQKKSQTEMIKMV